MFRKLQRCKKYPPIKIWWIGNFWENNYCVKALANLEKNTIISEYLGDVMTTEEYDKKFDEGTLRECGRNSRFTLLKTDHKSSSLEIVPEYHSNIARFLNSANLDEVDKTERKFRNNVEVFRADYNGEVIAVLYTNRKISAGEELKWNYGLQSKGI